MQTRYTYRRNGAVIRTRWADRETAQQRMAARIGAFHDCGAVAGDGDSRPDGSHTGCARNGGMLSRDVKPEFHVFEEADGWHWCAKNLGYLDARGRAYPSRAAAQRAARAHYADLMES